MAYGNGDKATLKRMVSLGVGCLTDAKLSGLLLLRERYIETANALMSAVFLPEPLMGLSDSTEIESKLLALQKSLVGLNKTYVEKARMAVKAQVGEVHRRYLRQLVGRARHCGSRIDEPNSSLLFYFVPEALQHTVTQESLDDLAARCLTWKGAVDLFRAVIVNDDPSGLSEHQQAILKHIHQQVQDRYRCPVYGRDDEFVCQIHLDYRVVRGLSDGALTLNDASAQLLVDADNITFQHFLEVSHPTPRGGVIRLPLSLHPRQVRRLGVDGIDTCFKAFVLEIGAHTVTIKGVVERAPDLDLDAVQAVNAKPVLATDELCQSIVDRLNQCTHLIGRDFGYTNTVSMAVVRRDHDILPEDIAHLLALRAGKIGDTKTGMHDWFTTRTCLDGEVVEEVMYSGKGFLDRLATQCARIDRLKSQIDGIYNKVASLKSILAGHYGLDDDALIDQAVMPDDPLMRRVHTRFFALLANVTDLKRKRRGIYKKIASVKKSWFGFLTNIERRLAKQYNAAVVREDLTVVATEKGRPTYKGRLFNKMINNGAKGQYIRRATDKLRWDGVPEIALPSPYTSKACTRHAVLGERKGEVFRCQACGTDKHADLHAATNIAQLLLLQPRCV